MLFGDENTDKLRKASMRPGFYIPECPKPSGGAVAHSKASMRPGFYIPECNNLADLRRIGIFRFNEAGILHPGMPLGLLKCDIAVIRFNEAGILHPGMLMAVVRRQMRNGSFNEAGILHPGMRQNA